MVAALSPQIDWEDAKLDLVKLLYGDEEGYRSLPENLIKARLILAGKPPAQVLGGKKVLAFWDNLAEPGTSTRVTLDSHMANIFGYQPYEVFQLKHVYESLEGAIADYAEYITMKPHQVQATLWVGLRGSRPL
jgi:hypothetical protein